MSKVPPFGWIALGLGTAILCLLALQYPWATTWPIGGDAASYIRQTQTILDISHPQKSFATLSSSRYPGVLILLGLTRAVPIEWPSRYVLLVVAGHIATGLAIAWLLLRHRHWPAATVGMVIWAMTTTSVNHHFESGTVAQLWSLPFAVLAVERLIARAPRSLVTFASISTLVHPLTGVLITLTGIGVLGFWLPGQKEAAAADRRLRLWLIGITVFFGLALILMSWLKPVFWNALQISEEPFVLGELIRSYFGPYILLLPAGLFVSLRFARHNSIVQPLLLTWVIVLICTLGSYLFGVSVAPDRFQTYLIVTAAILSGIALPHLASTLSPSRTWATLFVGLLLLHGVATAWSGSAGVYRYYENPDRYARLHPGEAAALAWLNQNVPADAYLTSTEANRHSEWIPILTDRVWEPIAPTHPLLQTIPSSAAPLPYTHIVFFHHREEVPTHLRQAPARIVYETADATIIELP